MVISDEAIDTMRDFWQTRTGKPIFREDARQATSDITALFNLLHEWDGRDAEGSGRDEHHPNGDGIPLHRGGDASR
jgi:hypothetical protein